MPYIHHRTYMLHFFISPRKYTDKNSRKKQFDFIVAPLKEINIYTLKYYQIRASFSVVFRGQTI